MPSPKLNLAAYSDRAVAQALLGLPFARLRTVMGIVVSHLNTTARLHMAQLWFQAPDAAGAVAGRAVAAVVTSALRGDSKN